MALRLALFDFNVAGVYLIKFAAQCLIELSIVASAQASPRCLSYSVRISLLLSGLAQFAIVRDVKWSEDGRQLGA